MQILTVPDDARGQAAVAMAEICRLKALAPDADWSDFAILARNRATLDPIRAWCHRENVRYRLSERENAGRPKFHQTREAHWLLDLLQAKRGRSLHPATLLRWFGQHFGSLTQDNPHLAQLGLFCEELEAVWGELRVPASLIVDELYDFSSEIARTEKDRLNLSTVHAAKGREFRHVVILDGGNWQQSTADERRLYYVGMTRAQETLALCQGFKRSNPFAPRLDGPGITHCPLPNPLPDLHGLARKYQTLSLADVDLSFAGRKPVDDSIHAQLDRLSIGQPLEIFPLESGWGLRLAGEPLTLGRLASKYTLPTTGKIEARVDSIIRRYRDQSKPEFAKLLKSEHWHVLLPSFSWCDSSADG